MKITRQEPKKNHSKLISLYILCEFSRFRRLQQRRIEVQKRHGEREKKNWISAGIYLQLRVTLNLFLFFLSSPLYPKRQFIWKTVTEQRITELPNCFIPSSISLSHSLLLLHFIVVVVVVEAACYCCVVKALKRTYTHTRPRKIYTKRNGRGEREKEPNYSWHDGNFLTVFCVHNNKKVCTWRVKNCSTWKCLRFMWSL